MRIGITGGTFDPVHYGHLLISEIICEEYNLDKIIFVPAKIPPHKREQNISEPKHRLDMLKLAINENEKFEISEYEINNNEESYTYKTLEYFKQVYKARTELFFLCGADSVVDMKGWKYPERVFAVAQIICATRPSNTNEELLNSMNYLKETYDAKIHVTRTLDINISSSSIRERVSNKETVRYMLPDQVIDYINKQNIYK